MVVAVTRPRAQGYGASIGDEWFRLAAAPEYPLRQYTRDSLAPRQDDAGSPEENVLDLGYAFSRSNLTGGEGLDWFPRADGEPEGATDGIRYWDSENLTIRRPDAGEPYQLTLVPDIETWWTPGSGNPIDMGASKDRLYVIHDVDVYRFDDLTDTTADATDDISALGGWAGTVLQQIAVGSDNSVAILDDVGDIWFKGAQTEVYVQLYDASTDGQAAQAIWWVKDRLIAACNDASTADAGNLREIAPVMGGTPAAPTVTPVTTTFDTFEGDCLAVVDAGHAIIAGFSDGELRSYVPQTDTAGGAPSLTIRGRTPMPRGEVPYALGHNLGALLVLTIDTNLDHLRFYTGQVLDERFDYVVGGMQLIRVWTGVVESSPAYTKKLVATRDELFFWVGEANNDWNLWRFDLVTSGMFRHGRHSLVAPLSTAYFEDGLVFLDGADVKRQDQSNLMSEGYLISPNITFGLNTPINWVAFITEVQNLAGGGYVELWRTGEPTAIKDPTDTNWILTDSLTDLSQSGLERSVVNQTSTSLALMVKIYAATDLSQAPQVSRFAVRGFPKHRDYVVEVPVNVSDYADAPGRMPLRIPGLGDETHELLLALDGAATELTVLDPPVIVRGVVDQIMEPVAYISDRGSQGRVCIVVFRGNRTSGTGTSQAQGNAGLGVPQIGVTTMGIGQVGI